MGSEMCIRDSRKSYMGFPLVPKSVTLNDLERRNGVILRYFSEFRWLLGALRKSSRSLSHLLMSSCIFSERVRYMLSPVRLSSVMFVRPTQAVQIFGNISTALGTLAIH